MKSPFIQYDAKDNAFFIDSKQRKISLQVIGIDIWAYHNSEKIGEFEFEYEDEDCIGSITLMRCDIKSIYQRAGIGTAMLYVAKKWMGNFSIDSEQSVEGASFISKCQEEGII